MLYASGSECEVKDCDITYTIKYQRKTSNFNIGCNLESLTTTLLKFPLTKGMV